MTRFTGKRLLLEVSTLLPVLGMFFSLVLDLVPIPDIFVLAFFTVVFLVSLSYLNKELKGGN